MERMTFNSDADVRAYLHGLVKINGFFHLDDDPSDIPFEHLDKPTRKNIISNWRAMWKAAEKGVVSDPWAIVEADKIKH